MCWRLLLSLIGLIITRTDLGGSTMTGLEMKLGIKYFKPHSDESWVIFLIMADIYKEKAEEGAELNHANCPANHSEANF